MVRGVVVGPSNKPSCPHIGANLRVDVSGTKHPPDENNPESHRVVLLLKVCAVGRTLDCDRQCADRRVSRVCVVNINNAVMIPILIDGCLEKQPWSLPSNREIRLPYFSRYRA